MAEEHESFMRMAIEEAAKGKAEGNAAIGSVIVKDGRVIGLGRNLVAATSDPTAHAETVALRQAGMAWKEADFSGCTLYTTFEPCPMCCGAIMNAGIGTVVLGGRPAPGEGRFGPYSIEWFIEESGWAARVTVVSGVLADEGYDICRRQTR